MSSVTRFRFTEPNDVTRCTFTNFPANARAAIAVVANVPTRWRMRTSVSVIAGRTFTSTVELVSVFTRAWYSVSIVGLTSSDH